MFPVNSTRVVLYFYVQCISIVTRKANSTIEQQNCKGHEKRDQLLVSKADFDFQTSQRNKNFTYGYIFLELG